MFGGSPLQVRVLLGELRDLLVEEIASAFAAKLKAARNDLVQLAERSGTGSRRAHYESALSILGTGSATLLAGFRTALQRDSDQAIAALLGDAGAGGARADRELSLVDRDAFERDLAIGRLSNKSAYRCSEQLIALDRRIASIAGRKRLDADVSPYTLKRVFTAFMDAIAADWQDEEAALVLLEIFEHYVGGALPSIYRDLNQRLVERGVLPDLQSRMEEPDPDADRDDDPAGADRFESAPSTAAPFPDRPSQAARSAAAPPAGASRAAPSAGKLFSQAASSLLRAPAGAGASKSGAAAGRWDPSSLNQVGGLTDAERSELDTIALSQLLESLTGLQRGSAQAATKLGLDRAALETAGGNLLHGLMASPLLRSLQPVDAVTVNLTANLFDCILADRDVPDSLLIELGRLQLPILKVALMNKAFFADQQHPARRLMDLIATATYGWSSGDVQLPLDAVRRAVTRVLEDFDNDEAVFRAQVDRLEQIFRDAEEKARANVSELVERLARRDRRHVAYDVVDEQLDARLAGTDLPPAIIDFIYDCWQELLARIYVKLGDRHPDWRGALATLDDLIWSVQPKATTRELERLILLLPELLRRLPEGMARIGRSEDWNDVLAALMPLHMEAIKSDAIADGDSRTAYAPPPARDPVAEDAERLDDPDVPAYDAAGDPKDPYQAAAARLKVGDWVEFPSVGASSRILRVTWLSRISGLLLFADRTGGSPLVITRTSLAAQLRDRSARVLSQEGLTDRAVAQLLVHAGL